MAKVTFDFYKLEGDSLDVFYPLLCNAEKDIKYDNTKYTFNDKFTIAKIISSENFISIVFTRLRMDNLPVKTNIVTGERSELSLDENEGLGEDTVFTYNKDLHIVSFQRNIHSISFTNSIQFIKKIIGDFKISFVPVLKKDALKRFLKLDILKKIRVKFAGTNDVSFLNDSGFSTTQKAMLTAFFNEPFVDITISSGRGKSNINHVIDFIKNIVYLHKEQKTDKIMNVEITGKETEDSKTILIDLLQDKLISIAEIDNYHRHIDLDNLILVSRNAILQNSGEFR